MDKKYEIGRRVGNNIYYTGFTLMAKDKVDAKLQYFRLSKEEYSNDIVVNEIY